MTDKRRPKPSFRQADRGGRADIARLSVTLPRDTLMHLKIHAAQHQATMRHVVAAMIEKELGGRSISESARISESFAREHEQ